MNKRTELLIAWLLACVPSLCTAHGEFTPWYGYQFGGSFEDVETGAEYQLSDTSAGGAILDIDLNEYSQVEFYINRQETEVTSGGLLPTETLFDLDIDYYHIGGTYILSRDTWQPFVVGTLGATHLSPHPSSIGSLTRFSVGLGGGVRYFPTEHLGLYLGVRGFFTFIDTAIRISSGGEGGTVAVRTNGILQGQLQAGLILRF